MENRTFQVGDILFKEGDEGTSAFLIKEGEVKITKVDGQENSKTLAHLGKGNIIGEMALIDDSPRAATIVAMGEVQAMEISRADFQKRLKNSDPVISLLLQTLTNRLRQQSEKLAQISAF